MTNTDDDDDNPTVRCSICGSRIAQGGQFWLGNAILLSDWEAALAKGDIDTTSQDVSRVECHYGIREIEAELEHNMYQHFNCVRECDGESRAALIFGHGMDPEEDHLPVHRNCLIIAKMIMSIHCLTPRQTGGPSGKVTSMRQLWKIFYSRWELTYRLKKGDQLVEPSDYTAGFLAIKKARDEDGKWGDRYLLPDIFDQNPMAIDNLSEYIASLLQQTPASLVTAAENSHAPLASHLVPLPQEVWLQIMESLGTQWHDPPPSLQCVRFVPPEMFRERILSGEMLPFLWDLDPTAFDRKPASEWDYEDLARKLAQPDIFETLPEPPNGLRNRRRIWKLLEDMSFEDEEAKS